MSDENGRNIIDTEYWSHPCTECQGNGDDYYLDSNDELISSCDGCPYNEYT